MPRSRPPSSMTNARKLGELLGASTAVKTVEYPRERRGRWLIEHGRAGDDYLFQLHPLKVLALAWQDVITGFIARMDGIFPRSVPIYYRRPDEQWEIKFFTIKVENVCRLLGWETAAKKAIDALAAVEAWAAPRTAAPPDQSSPPGKRGSDEGPDESAGNGLRAGRHVLWRRSP